MSRFATLCYVASIGSLAAHAESPLRTRIVLAHYKEDVSWVSQYTGKENIDVIIYSKAAVMPEVAGALALPLSNFGRESHTYLHHIVHHYESLADWTVFSQATPPSWGYLVGDSTNGHLNDKVSFDDYVRPFPEGRDSFFVMNAASQFPRAVQLNRHGIIAKGLPEEGPEMCPRQGAAGWTDWWFLPDHPHLRKGDMLEFYHKYVALSENDHKPLTLAFAQGARFAMSRERIHARPKEYYARMLVALSKEKNPQEGFWMEAVWWDVFHPEALQSKTPLCPLPVLGETVTKGPYKDSAIADSIRARVPKPADSMFVNLQGLVHRLRGQGR
eukprot:CAMPEP_0183393658 /NCGR_PEP_ID=MMETSP0370-20130417/8071_1 /TAXON_ID=268820 /ORGANISM="Peridinium aciculiferum, Strain PAER-2" /LENGTH=328 /DNA_ID=CAMNT_0025573909 /DNA_START=15 /DNA_END=1001 /DNA_ORIENTATION=+